MKIYYKNRWVDFYSSLRNYPPFQCKNGIFFYICLIFFCWYANDPDLFERKYFLNEVFSLIGLFLFLWNPVVYKRNDYLYNIVVLILVIFLVYAALSLFIYDNFYGYLRNSVIVYSIFAFFLGIKLYDILSRVSKKDLVFLSALFPSVSFYRTGYAVLLPLYLSRFFKTFTAASLGTVVSVMAAGAVYYGGQTAWLVIGLLLLLSIMNRWIRIASFVVLGAAVVAFFIFIAPYHQMLMEGNWWTVEDKHYLFKLDGNLTMRFFYWSYVFYDDFIESLFGIGLGTPLFTRDFLEWRLFLWHSIRPDPYAEYTMGAHNSFLTILARFGIMGIAPFLVLYWKLTADFIECKMNSHCRRLLFFYYAFFIITGCAMVNVVLESPIHAALYWGTLGMLYQARHEYGSVQGVAVPC